jgi:ABC-type lipoprotein release transport system permease subunit
METRPRGSVAAWRTFHGRGAAPPQIVRLFVLQGSRIIGVGLVLGVLLTLVATRLIERELYGISPRDPVALGSAVLAFGLAGLAAVWAPARRAARTDPAAALRAD